MLARLARPADVALGAVAAGVGLRVWAWFANWPLWLDEQAIAIVLRDRGYGELTGPLANNTSAPLGWLWAQRLVIEQIGTGERALRLMPMLFAVGTVVAAWLVGRRFLGAVGTFALTGLCAVNLGFLAYTTQVKHYTGDTFFALVLVGLAWWVLQEPAAVRRWAVWWVVAAVGSFISMGAFLVVPGLFVVLAITAWRRAGWLTALRGALLGLVWLVSFGANYLFSLRATAVGNIYLDRIWAHGYPEPDAGPAGVIVWVVKRVAVLAEDPLYLGAGIGGRPWPFIVGAPFWLLVLAGIVVAYRRRPELGFLVAAPIVSAFLFGIAHQVPLLARLALWVVPVLYLAVAIALEAAASAFVAWRSGDAVGRPRLVAATLALMFLAILVPAGRASVARAGGQPDHDDRAAVEFMRSRHRPGDLTLVVGFAGRGLEWYDAGHTLQPAATVLSKPAGSGPAGSGPVGSGCDREMLRRAVAGFARVIAYGGARIPPYGATVDVLRDELAGLGTIVETRQLTGTSVVYIVNLRAAPSATARANGADCVVVR